jgi:hypothetical protein
MVPARSTFGDFIALVNSRTERTDLRHVWVDGCEVSPADVFQNHYRSDRLLYLTDTDSPPTNAEFRAAGRGSQRPITIVLIGLTGRRTNVVVDANGTVDAMKDEIMDRTGITPSTPVVLGQFGRTVLEDGHYLSEYGIEEGSVVSHLLPIRSG